MEFGGVGLVRGTPVADRKCACRAFSPIPGGNGAYGLIEDHSTVRSRLQLTRRSPADVATTVLLEVG